MQRVELYMVHRSNKVRIRHHGGGTCKQVTVLKPQKMYIPSNSLEIVASSEDSNSKLMTLMDQSFFFVTNIAAYTYKGFKYIPR